jgi:hypothetical protein
VSFKKMRCFCCVTAKLKKPVVLDKQRQTTMDFRRADPRYVNFIPATCADAIDLFDRHRKLGLTPDLYPECFVHCARALKGEELDYFHRYIICPSGDIEKGGEGPTEVDRQLEKERKLLLCEAAARDSGLTNTGLTNIEEASQEDEKMQIDEPSEDIEMLPMRRQGAGRQVSEDEEKSTSRGSTSGLCPSSESEALCSEMGYLHISQS